LQSTGLRLAEDDADALKHVAVLMVYKILYIRCTFFGTDNKLCKMHGTFIKIWFGLLTVYSCIFSAEISPSTQ